MDAHGHAIRRAFGVVPRHLPQNAVTAKWCALGVALQFAMPGTATTNESVTVWQDCRAVTDEWTKPWQKRLRYWWAR